LRADFNRVEPADSFYHYIDVIPGPMLCKLQQVRMHV
jgi:hypothetical protein